MTGQAIVHAIVRFAIERSHVDRSTDPPVLCRMGGMAPLRWLRLDYSVLRVSVGMELLVPLPMAKAHRVDSLHCIAPYQKEKTIQA